jgi:hypothetical protein
LMIKMSQHIKIARQAGYGYSFISVF